MNNTKIIGIIALVASFIFGQSFDTHEITRTENAQFSLKSDGHLHIKNKYGYVKIKTWDKQEAKIDVFIKVDARNERKAQELMDRIQISLSESSGNVYAETSFEDTKNSVNWNYNTSFTIDYDVYMPKNAFLHIYNKYGNSEIDALDRSVDAEIKYGNITMGDINGDVELMLGYGNANLGNMKKFNTEIKYSNLNMGDALDTSMETKYSKLTLGNVGQMRITSKYDTYRVQSAESFQNSGKYDDIRIQSVGKFEIDSKYTNVDIVKLTESATIYQKYGDIDIDELGGNVNTVKIDVRYVDVKLGNLSAGYTLDFEGEYTGVRNKDGFDATIDKEDGSDTTVKGTYGNGKTKIVAEMEYGKLTIR